MNGQIYYTYERPVRYVAGAAIEAGTAVVIGTTLGDYNGCVPVVEVAGAGVAPEGFALETVAEGEFVDVVVEVGVTLPAVIGGAVAVGDLLATNASGRLVKAGTSTLATARAVMAGSTAGQIVSVLRIAPTTTAAGA